MIDNNQQDVFKFYGRVAYNTISRIDIHLLI